MRVSIQVDDLAVAKCAAEIIANLVRAKPNAVLGLATGGTVVKCYQELIQMHRGGTLDFSNVRTFNLDEYVGLGRQHPQSYHRYMQENLFAHVNLRPENCHIPDGLASDLLGYGVYYEELIQQAGGIDLQLLGIGRDGHIAFNEPGSSLGSRTRVKTLTQETIADNARYFGSLAEVPQVALTMGVGTILETRRCLLLATGSSKAMAIQAAIEGPVTAQVTASALQMHRDVTVILDQPAAAGLERVSYYRQVEEAERHLAESLRTSR